MKAYDKELYQFNGRFDQSIDFFQYYEFMRDVQHEFSNKSLWHTGIATIFFIAGLFALYNHLVFITVVSLLISIVFNQSSSHCVLIHAMSQMQWPLVLLINQHTCDIKAIKSSMGLVDENKGDPDDD